MNESTDTKKRLNLDPDHTGPVGPKPSRDQFAEMVLTHIRRRCPKETWIYDCSIFSIIASVSKRGLLLERLYDAYRTGVDEWQHALNNMIKTIMMDDADIPLSEHLNEARDHLVPQVYHRAELCSPEMDPSKWQSHLLVGDHLAVGLVRDFETGFIPVNAEMLRKWNIGSDEAMSVAMENFRTQHSRPGIRIGKGTYNWEFDDDLNPANILITEQIARLKLKGDPIALPYGRNRLIVTGSDDEDGLSELIAATTVPTFRHITDTPIIYTQGNWQTWAPDIESSHGESLRKLRAMETASWYLHRKSLYGNADIHVPTVEVFEHERLGRAVTCCIWQINLPSPLPQTEFIHIIDMDYELGAIEFARAAVPWGVMAPVIQELFKLAPGYPPILMPTRPLTAEEKTQIRQIANQHGFGMP